MIKGLMVAAAVLCATAASATTYTFSNMRPVKPGGSIGDYVSFSVTTINGQASLSDVTDFEYVNADYGPGSTVVVDLASLTKFSASVVNSFVTDYSFTGNGRSNIGPSGSYSFSKAQEVPYDPSALPEPATWGMMIVGMGLVGASMRRRAAQSKTATA